MNPNEANRRRLAEKYGLPRNAPWKKIREAMPSCSICYKKGKLIPCPRSSNPCKEGSVCSGCATEYNKCPLCRAPHHPKEEEPTSWEEEEFYTNDHGLFNVREYFRRLRRRREDYDDDDLSSISSSSTAEEGFFGAPDFMEF